jgi:hypothetical protein
MRYTTIIFLLLTISSCGQSTTIDLADKRRLQIDKQITTDKSNLIVLAKVKGQDDLLRVINENWPENIETTFNILKNQNGQIIYIGEFPTSESGDWDLELKHYFADNGRIVAFEKRLAYFNDNCGDGIVVEKQIELYDNLFKVLKTTNTLTDKSGKALSETECGNAYDWDLDKRATVKELVDLKKIRP